MRLFEQKITLDFNFSHFKLSFKIQLNRTGKSCSRFNFTPERISVTLYIWRTLPDRSWGSMYFVATVVLDSKGVSFVSTCRVDLTGVVVRGGLLVIALIVVFVVTMGLCVIDSVVDLELDTPGSMSSFGFIGNPVRVEFFTGKIVVLLSGDLVISSATAVLYPAIENLIRKSPLKLNEM